jgi:hypothetical protein
VDAHTLDAMKVSAWHVGMEKYIAAELGSWVWFKECIPYKLITFPSFSDKVGQIDKTHCILAIYYFVCRNCAKVAGVDPRSGMQLSNIFNARDMGRSSTV